MGFFNNLNKYLEKAADSLEVSAAKAEKAAAQTPENNSQAGSASHSEVSDTALMDANQKFFPEDWVKLRDKFASEDGQTLRKGSKWQILDNRVKDGEIVYECVTADRSKSYVLPQSVLEVSTAPAARKQLKNLPLTKGTRVKDGDGNQGTIIEICDIYNGYDYIVNWDSGMKIGATQDEIKPL